MIWPIWSADRPPNFGKWSALPAPPAAGSLSTDSVDCSRPGAVPAGANYRWVAFQNLLPEVRGPEWLDDALAEALRGTGTP